MSTQKQQQRQLIAFVTSSTVGSLLLLSIVVTVIAHPSFKNALILFLVSIIIGVAVGWPISWLFSKAYLGLQELSDKNKTHKESVNEQNKLLR